MEALTVGGLEHRNVGTEARRAHPWNRALVVHGDIAAHEDTSLLAHSAHGTGAQNMTRREERDFRASLQGVECPQRGHRDHPLEKGLHGGLRIQRQLTLDFLLLAHDAEGVEELDASQGNGRRSRIHRYQWVPHVQDGKGADVVQVSVGGKDSRWRPDILQRSGRSAGRLSTACRRSPEE